MGKSQPLEELLAELAIYEATVSTWDLSDGSILTEAQSAS